MTLEKLYQIILDRKKNLPKDSYVVSLFQKGNDRIVQKVGEEAIEVVIAAKNRSKERLVAEVADLWFHSLILLAEKGIKFSEVLSELGRRKKPQVTKE